ncbi:portal protein [Gordonia phage Secretariat]|uniref:Portal protein n=1 Tax=Gordonia phage Secretariat TaxID=2725616 RepID=A0A6M3SUQ5_9CAUD|nr:portal protein [Gordonia phage Secretariat]QJD49596.1 portal protein [Gordonia phage Secretariat]
MASIAKKMRHAYNTFTAANSEKEEQSLEPFGSASYGSRPDRVKAASGTMGERSIITAIYTRIGIDIASIQMRHVRLDDQNRFMSDMDSGLNHCLTVEANIDQGSRDFRQDIAMTLCSEGYLAIVPVDTSLNPAHSSSYDILTMRVGRIVAWHPKRVRVSLYNENTGLREEIVVSKENVAIVTNPLYAIMNEPNSTLQRLVRKLNLLDSVDEASASGKLDMIIQLPYVIKSEARRQQAEQRRTDIEDQLRGSKYGIAYTDGTEKITQLNRPVENNLMAQVTYLTEMLYGQLGITEAIMNGTADEKTMLNYWNRTIEPITAAITESMHRTFLSKTARSQKQAVRFFRDPFRLVPIENIAEIADKFTRNEIMSSNEFRQVVGMIPSGDPKADQLINSNMPQTITGAAAAPETIEGEVVDAEEDDGSEDAMNGSLDSLNSKLDEMFSELGGED